MPEQALAGANYMLCLQPDSWTAGIATQGSRKILHTRRQFLGEAAKCWSTAACCGALRKQRGLVDAKRAPCPEHRAHRRTGRMLMPIPAPFDSPSGGVACAFFFTPLSGFRGLPVYRIEKPALRSSPVLSAVAFALRRKEHKLGRSCTERKW